MQQVFSEEYDLKRELKQAKEHIKVSKISLSYYKACFEIMQAACTPAIEECAFQFALDFIRDNKLGGNANDCYFLAGDFLEEAVNDFYNESKIYIDHSKTLEEQAEFRYLFRKRGLMESIGAKMLKKANRFLREQGFSHIKLETIIYFLAEWDRLLIRNVEEVEALLKEPLEKLDFNALELEAQKGPLGYTDYFCFKCLVKLINETKEYDNDWEQYHTKRAWQST